MTKQQIIEKEGKKYKVIEIIQDTELLIPKIRRNNTNFLKRIILNILTPRPHGYINAGLI